MLIPEVDFGGDGDQIHFAHANGFHPKMYGELLAEFSSAYNVNAKLFRPFWEGSDYRSFNSWNILADDQIKYFDQKGFKNVIGMGHSMGAISSVLACHQRPDLFSKLVLIEPVILQRKYYLINLLPQSLRLKMVPPAKSSIRRKDQWKSKEEAYHHLRPKKVFKGIPDSVFKEYIEYGMKPSTSGGVTLSYSKEWETQVYCNGTNPWKALKSLKIPVLIIRGVDSNVLTHSVWRHMNSTLSNFNFGEIEGSGHLVPFEKKSEITKVILDFMAG